jgi:hypothetical protein
MHEEKEKKGDACMMHATDSRGNPNLCCCYIVDSDGRYVDACYRPVTDCNENLSKK